MEKKENCNKKCKLLRNFKKHVKNIFCNICTLGRGKNRTDINSMFLQVIF